MSVDLDLVEHSRPEKIRAHVLGTIHTELKDELSKLMDQLCPQDEIIRIDRLELNLGKVKLENLNKAISRELFNGINKAIAKAKMSKSTSFVEANLESLKVSGHEGRSVNDSGAIKTYKGSEDQKLNTLLYFLEYGVLPWWKCFSAQQEIEKFVRTEVVGEQIEPEAKNRKGHYQEVLKRFFLEKKIARNRFIVKFSESDWRILIRNWFPNEVKTFFKLKESLEVLFKLMRLTQRKELTDHLNVLFFDSVFIENQLSEEKLKRDVIYAIDQFYRNKIDRIFYDKLRTARDSKDFLSVSAVHQKNIEEIVQLILNSDNQNAADDIISGNPKLPETGLESEKLNAESNSVKHEITFGYAGIVIIWPMLTTLFQNRGLIENGEFKGLNDQLKAVQLLNYLVAGENDLEEFDMPLNKLLCGLPIDELCEFYEPLINEDKAEVDELLNHVIKSWPALKNTSPDGLRSAFLAREGELRMHNEIWFLKVEQNGIDILLNKLPWGYQTVKLSWMSNLIQVEW